MLLNEAKQILKKNGFILESNIEYENKTIELLESDELKELAKEIQKLQFEGKQAFPISRFGNMFNGYKYGFMIRIQIPNSDNTGTFINVYSAHSAGGSKISEGFKGGTYGFFWHIVKTLEELGIYKNWIKLFRSADKYPLDKLIPFLKDLLKVWDEPFYKIVKKFSDEEKEADITADIAKYKGKNWSGD
jgi:hypothetical protein